jgi:glycosyltransferase involved in cell wall biosynthesis
MMYGRTYRHAYISTEASRNANLATDGKADSARMAPDVSIVMPVYNTGHPMVEAIRSVASQDTRAAWQLLIVDDRSDDPVTLGILRDASRADARIRVIGNDGPRGPGPARNAGVRAAAAPWIGFLDSDDVWPAGSLERRWRRLAGGTGAEWIGGNYMTWAPNDVFELAGAPIQTMFGAGTSEVTLRRPVEFLTRYTALLGTMLIRRTAMDRAGGFDDRVFYGDDWYLNLKLAASADLVFLADVLLHLRRHGPSLTTSEKYQMGVCDQAIPAALANPLLRPYRSFVRSRLVDELLQLAGIRAARGAAWDAARLRLRALAAAPADPGTWRRVIRESVGVARGS